MIESTPEKPARRSSRLIRAAALAAALVTILVAVLLGRALTLSSTQVEVSSITLPTLDADAAVERFQAALRVPTISREEGVDTEALLRLHTLLEESFPRVHAELEREIVGGYSLLYSWPGSDASLPPAVLLGHLDVVPADDADAWTHPPFSAILAEGYIWARGSMDDKINVLGLLEATEHLLSEGFTPTRSVYLAFGHDEEIGGREGAVQMARQLAERGVKPAFVLDEGMVIVRGQMPGVEAPVALIGIAEKGYATLELSADAAGGHSSMPPRDGAVARLARALVRLDAAPLPSHLDGPAGQLFEVLAPEMPLAQRLLFANRWLFDPLIERILATSPGPDALLRTTTAMTMLEGSAKDNILPSTARARVNFRVHPNEDIASVTEAVRKRLEDPEIRVEPTGFVSEPSPVSPRNSLGYALIERTVREVFPEALAAPTLVLGATDARHYTDLTDSVYRFAPIVVEPSDLARVHGRDERLSVEGYLQAIQFYRRLLEALSLPST